MLGKREALNLKIILNYSKCKESYGNLLKLFNRSDLLATWYWFDAPILSIQQV